VLASSASLDAAVSLPGAVPDPAEDVRVVGVGAELPLAAAPQPRVLAGPVEGGAGEVQPARGLAVADLGLEPGQDPQGLGVALEPAAGRAELVEGPFAVVAEGRMADVVGEPGGVHDVRVAAQLLGDPAADLRDLQRVRQPGARDAADLGALPRPDDLGLPREPAQRGGVQDSGAVPGERAAALAADAFAQARALRRFGEEAGAGALVVGVRSGVRTAPFDGERHPSPVFSVSTDAWVSR
jgi:hypothetical protein